MEKKTKVDRFFDLSVKNNIIKVLITECGYAREDITEEMIEKIRPHIVVCDRKTKKPL